MDDIRGSIQALIIEQTSRISQAMNDCFENLAISCIRSNIEMVARAPDRDPLYAIFGIPLPQKSAILDRRASFRESIYSSITELSCGCFMPTYLSRHCVHSTRASLKYSAVTELCGYATPVSPFEERFSRCALGKSMLLLFRYFAMIFVLDLLPISSLGIYFPQNYANLGFMRFLPTPASPHICKVSLNSANHKVNQHNHLKV